MSDVPFSSSKNPTKAAVQGLLYQLEKQTDYLFFHFGGHGHHPYRPGQLPQLASTSLCLNDAEEITVSEIAGWQIRRQTIIVDACRVLNQILAMSASRAFANLAEKRASIDMYRPSCRALYSEAIEAAEYGTTEIYSCSLNETAADGLFTPSIISAGEEWAIRNESSTGRANAIYSIREAFQAASADTTAQKPQQHPHRPVERRMNQFPFAVA